MNTKTTQASTRDIVSVLNGLLRGELSAVETYTHAIDRLDCGPALQELKNINVDHVDAVRTLTAHVNELGGEPDDSAGVWGAFAKAVEGTASLLGDKMALRALKAGEESGEASYQGALREELPVRCTTLIHTKLLPRTSNHIVILDRLIHEAELARR